MAATLKALAGSTAVPAVLTTAYTVPGATKCRLQEVTFCNTSGATRTVRLQVGGEYVAYDLDVPVGLPVVLTLNTVLEAAETVAWQASNAAGVEAKLSGIEIA